MKFAFVFENYQVTDGSLVELKYRYQDETGQPVGKFTEQFRLPVQVDSSNTMVNYILQQLHIIAGISYYKSLLGTVETPYMLTDEEAAYYNEIYDKGLGEYSYVNGVTEPIRPFSSDGSSAQAPQSLETSGALLGIGGGKDSIVAGEIFKGIELPTTLLDIATRDHQGQAADVMRLMELPNMVVERYVDTSLVTFTEQHTGRNGHIPISAVFAWVGVLLAYVMRKKYVAMANESAASSGNVVWNGHEVNHQWSKSLEHERLTQNFITKHISPDIIYFSPIRPYGSLAVMDLLAKLGRNYLEDFTSCNLVLRIDPSQRPNGRWCTRCAKCLSTWLLLSSWLDTEQLTTIFGRDLWEDTSLRPTLEALLGLAGHKPLDCVGTIDELRAVTRKQLTEGGLHPVLRGITPEAIPGPGIQELVEARGEACIPPELRETIEGFVAKTLASS